MPTVVASKPCKDCGVPITHPGGKDYPDKGGYNVETDAQGNEFADVPHSETCSGEPGMPAKEPSDAAKAASLKRREPPEDEPAPAPAAAPAPAPRTVKD